MLMRGYMCVGTSARFRSAFPSLFSETSFTVSHPGRAILGSTSFRRELCSLQAGHVVWYQPPSKSLSCSCGREAMLNSGVVLYSTASHYVIRLLWACIWLAFSAGSSTLDF